MKDNDADKIDVERTQTFFDRALGETQRMNREVEKSKKKRDKLYEEFGSERFQQWQDEHVEVVLSNQQQSPDQ